MDIGEVERIKDLVKRSLYSRYRPNFGGYITFYARDTKTGSPTGVISIGGCPATEEYYKIISSVDSRVSPLSPTENLNKGC